MRRPHSHRIFHNPSKSLVPNLKSFPPNGMLISMSIDLSSFNMGPEWNQSAPGSKLPPKRAKKQKQASAPKSDGTVRVGRETKGRKGAGVTVITGIQSHPEGLKQIAKELKQTCGSGGTVKGGVIEIQGDHRDLLVTALKKSGYTVKRAGG